MTDNETALKSYTVSVYVTPSVPFVKATRRVCTIMLNDGETLLWRKKTKVAKNVNATSVALAFLAEALPALAPKIADADAPLIFAVYSESIRSILLDGYVNRRYREEIRTLMGSAVNVIPNREIRVEILSEEPSTRGLKGRSKKRNHDFRTKSLVDVLIEDFSNELQS